jgi:hypothetical protein
VTTWRIHIAYWFPKAKNTLRLCNTYCFPLQQWLHKRSSASHYTCTESVVTEEFFSTSVWSSKQAEGTKFPVPGRLANMQSPTLWRSLCHQQYTASISRPSWTLNLEAAVSYKTSLTANQTTGSHIPEDLSLSSTPV